MSRRTTGNTLLVIAALLYSVRHVAAAIFGSGVTSWNERLFNSMLSSVGSELVTLSAFALVAGILFLVWAELESWGKPEAGK
jgi:hypothetical protein